MELGPAGARWYLINYNVFLNNKRLTHYTLSFMFALDLSSLGGICKQMN